MKKFTLALMALLSVSFIAKAQQYVSTNPANRNVILEEFTGRLCGYCPDGHIIANQIKANHPDRFWSVNIHSAGSSNFSTDTYPNLNTTKGNQIRAAFSANSFPSGVVNRSTASAQGRGSWTGLATQQMNQAAECNVAGLARINPDTRKANITVEVYYTGNSSVAENYLTVVMLQDSIMGSQSSGSSNPAQWINGQYCHMHILRDVITPVMGDAITPTTQGTLITKTYEYSIPESIGDPNGVEVKLEHISFLAWVSEQYQGTPTRPILNACELGMTFMTNDPIHPSVTNLGQQIKPHCSNTKSFAFTMTNIGLNNINSAKFNADFGAVSYDFEWAGDILPGDKTDIEFDVELPFGTFDGTLYITEVNGEAYAASWPFEAECAEWGEAFDDGDFTTLKVYIIQDQYGEQTTWDIINSAGEVIAEGGPYQHLVGSGATQVNAINLSDIPVGDCYLFRIYDSAKNGICCAYGNGYYYIKDAHNNRIVDGDGDFGAMAAHTFSIIKNGQDVVETSASAVNVYPNPANDKVYVEGDGIELIEVYNAMGQIMMEVKASDKTEIDINSFENGMYMLRIIGKETTTQTIIKK